MLTAKCLDKYQELLHRCGGITALLPRKRACSIAEMGRFVQQTRGQQSLSHPGDNNPMIQHIADIDMQRALLRQQYPQRWLIEEMNMPGVVVWFGGH